jgi:hypothetical protein
VEYYRQVETLGCRAPSDLTTTWSKTIQYKNVILEKIYYLICINPVIPNSKLRTLTPG